MLRHTILTNPDTLKRNLVLINFTIKNTELQYFHELLSSWSLELVASKNGLWPAELEGKYGLK
jgi:hypothetical protein